MVKSVYFPEQGKGYIYEKIEEPVKPDRSYRNWGGMSKEEYAAANRQYKKEHKAWEKVKDNYKLSCAKLLIGRKFEFAPNKINILFGPNGSGKSTILKAIAGSLHCGDGYTTFAEPIQFSNCWGIDEPESVRYGKDAFLGIIEKAKGNSSVVDVDGSPIYYHNFTSTEMHAHAAGDLMDSGIINSIEDEAIMLLYGSQISAGQKAAWLFNKLVKVIDNKVSLKDIVEPFMKRVEHANITWKTAFQTQYDYYAELPNFSKVSDKTLLLDEVDVNLDIETVYRLYLQVMPRFIEKYNTQVIAVSHNPIMLSNEIRQNPLYNVISIDEDYTKACIETYKNLSF